MHTLFGHAVVTLDSVIEACLLLVGISVQKAELVTLTQALQFTAGIWINVYSDSKCAFTNFHDHEALYKERGLINSGGNNIKYGQKIIELQDTVWSPKWVAVIHCHQKGK
jgi:hypothetical protein